MAKISSSLYSVNGGYRSRKYSNSRMGIIKSFAHNNPQLSPVKLGSALLSGVKHGFMYSCKKIGNAFKALSHSRLNF